MLQASKNTENKERETMINNTSGVDDRSSIYKKRSTAIITPADKIVINRDNSNDKINHTTNQSEFNHNKYHYSPSRTKVKVEYLSNKSQYKNLNVHAKEEDNLLNRKRGKYENRDSSKSRSRSRTRAKDYSHKTRAISHIRNSDKEFKRTSISQIKFNKEDIRNSNSSNKLGWLCKGSTCKSSINFLNRTYCYRCESPKPNNPEYVPIPDKLIRPNTQSQGRNNNIDNFNKSKSMCRVNNNNNHFSKSQFNNTPYNPRRTEFKQPLNNNHSDRNPDRNSNRSYYEIIPKVQPITSEYTHSQLSQAIQLLDSIKHVKSREDKIKLIDSFNN